MFVYVSTVIMCGISFICCLLNQLHLDLKNLSPADSKVLKTYAIKERQGMIFSVLIIIAVIVFVVISYLHFKNIHSTV